MKPSMDISLIPEQKLPLPVKNSFMKARNLWGLCENKQTINLSTHNHPRKTGRQTGGI